MVHNLDLHEKARQNVLQKSSCGLVADMPVECSSGLPELALQTDRLLRPGVEMSQKRITQRLYTDLAYRKIPA